MNAQPEQPSVQPDLNQNKLTIRVDADACPVSVRQTIERVARHRHIALIFYIDENHELNPSYGRVEQVGQGHDAVDLALVNQVVRGDLVVTQDYGLAALVLARQAEAIHPGGRVFNDYNIDRLLFERHLSAKARRAGQRTINPRRRRTADDKNFAEQLCAILDRRENTQQSPHQAKQQGASSDES